MRSFTARRLALAALVPALIVLSVIPGCSNGGEGERCGDPDGTVTNNSDCGSGLVCTAFTADGSTVGRCCYTDHVSDSRCLKSSGTSAFIPASGGAASAEAGPTSGDAGTANGGAGGALSMTPDLPAGAGGN